MVRREPRDYALNLGSRRSDETTKTTKRRKRQKRTRSQRAVSSLVCSSARLFVRSSACPLVRSSARLFVCSSVRPLVRLSARPLVRSSACPLVRSSARLFILFITLFTQQKKQHPEGCCFAINCLLIELDS